MQLIERRFAETEFEVRSEGSKITFEGYALKWNARSQNLGGFREQVAEGATTESVQNDDIRALFNHDPSLILGRNRSDTLRLSEDSTGLAYQVDMPDTSYARDLAESMRRGDVTQSSFGFRVVDDGWSIDEEDFPLRTLRSISLFDVSPVTYPAYTQSTSGLGARALEAFAESRGLTLDEVKADLKAAIRGGKTLRQTDPDLDPGKVAQAVDAAIDEALEELAEGDVESATALVQAADLAIDHLMKLLGVPDPSDPDEGDRSAFLNVPAINYDLVARAAFLRLS